MYIDQIIEAYRQQTVDLFASTNKHGFGIESYVSKELNGLYKKDGLGEPIAHTNQAELMYNTGGLFADCTLEASVLNLTLNPIYSMANLVPVVPSTLERVRYGFLTQIDDPDNNYPDEPCDRSPIVGDVSGACFAEYEHGRISYTTRSMELDALIKRAHKGILEDLYLVGNVRGVSAVPNQQMLSDRDFISRAAVRRQMALVGRAFQRDLINQFWVGDPTNGVVNTAGGGRREFWGLNQLIADDYGTPAKPFVTGTNCELLNSDVKTAGFCIGSGQSIYALMQELEDTLYNRAAYSGLLPVRWSWVLHPIIWSELVKHLPCEILTDSCVNTGPGGEISVGVNGNNGMGIQALRQQMMSSMSIMVNGRSYPVILDHGVPITQDGNTPPQYNSTIYLVPWTVAGERVLEFRHMDYTLFDNQLSPLPDTADVGLRGWTDGGRYHWIVERSRRCFEIDGKIELGLVFRAPFLAGRIDEVGACPLQAKPNWRTIPVAP